MLLWSSHALTTRSYGSITAWKFISENLDWILIIRMVLSIYVPIQSYASKNFAWTGPSYVFSENVINYKSENSEELPKNSKGTSKELRSILLQSLKSYVVTQLSNTKIVKQLKHEILHNIERRGNFNPGTPWATLVFKNYLSAVSATVNLSLQFSRHCCLWYYR